MSLQAKYTEEQKAVALAYYAACGENLAKAAHDCKIPRTTLQNWVNGGAVNGAVAEKSAQKKGDMADACEALAWKLLGGMDDEAKIEAAALNTLSVSFGTLIDKMRLLRDQSTQNLNVSDLSDAELDKRIAALERGEVPATDDPPEAP